MSEQALLQSGASEMESGTQTWEGKSNGKDASIVLHNDGSVEFHREAIDPKCLGFGTPDIDMTIPATDLVGASTLPTDPLAIEIWYMPIKNNNSNTPTRSLSKTPALQLASSEIASAAITAIRNSISPVPRRILAILNPASGLKTSVKDYNRDVKPILEAAGFQTTEHITTAQGHATKIIQSIAPGQFDTILSIGGDGTMFEVIQGLLSRPDWDSMRQVRLLQVPCGSGNALAASTGLWDVSTAVHAAVCGESTGLDIASIVQTPGERFFSFLSCTFGMISNLDIGTEHLRFLGSLRFVVGAIEQILKQKTFNIKVAYLPKKPDDVVDGEEKSSNSSDVLSLGHGPALKYFNGFDSKLMNGGGAEDLEKISAVTNNAAPAAELPEGWQWLPAEQVQLFAACNLPRLDMNFLFAPEAELHSGHMNLLFTAGKTGRKKGLELMSASEKGEHMHLVEQRLLRALFIEPGSEDSTWLVVDGEQVPHKAMYAEVHPQLCTVLRAPKL